MHVDSGCDVYEMGCDMSLEQSRALLAMDGLGKEGGLRVGDCWLCDRELFDKVYETVLVVRGFLVGGECCGRLREMFVHRVELDFTILYTKVDGIDLKEIDMRRAARFRDLVWETLGICNGSGSGL